MMKKCFFFSPKFRRSLTVNRHEDSKNVRRHEQRYTHLIRTGY